MSEFTNKFQASNLKNKIPSSVKKIVDFAFIEKFIECPLCLEQYDGEKFVPRILPCSHTYCTFCLDQLAFISDNNQCEKSLSQEIKLTCPQCLNEHVVNGKKNVSEAFPKNLALQQMLDIKPHLDTICEACQINFAVSNCIDCKFLVCSECKNNHKIKFIDELNKDTKKLSQICNEFICNFKNKIKDFLLSSTNAKFLINTTINEIICTLKERESFLLHEIDRLVNTKIEWFNAIQDGFISENDKIQDFLAEPYLNSDSDKELINVFNTCQQNLNSINDFISKNSDFTDQGQIKIEFEITNKLIESLKSHIKSFGSLVFVEKKLENEPDRCFDSFESVEIIKNTFWCPSGVKFNSLTKELFVADTFNRQIKVLDSTNGKLLSCHELSYFDQFTNKNVQITPRDLHFNTSGLLVITDSNNHKCHFLDSINFKVLKSFGENGHEKGQFKAPRGICIDSYDRIFVSDRGNHRIQVFDINGNYLNEWGSFGTCPGQFRNPEFLCITSRNHLIVSDTYNHRIQIFDVSSSNSNDIGTFVASFGTFGKKLGSFRFPKGVTTDDEGFIMVADWKNNRLQLFEPNGSFVTVISNDANDYIIKPIEFEKPVCICSISNGKIAFSNWGRTQNVTIL